MSAWLVLVLWLGCVSESDQALQARAYVQGTETEAPRWRGVEPLSADVEPFLRQAMTQPSTSDRALELWLRARTRLDPLAHRGVIVLRAPEDVKHLVEEALSERPSHRRAKLALLRNVSRADLRTHGAGLARLEPADRLTVRVLAKAGVGKATEEQTPEMLALRAATGDQQAEAALLARWRTASTGEARAEALDGLGWAATDTTLKAVAADIRSPFVRRIGNRYRSIRVDAVEALHPHFPYDEAFFPNQLASYKDLTRAEKRAIALLGATIDGEHPPFFIEGKDLPEGVWATAP